MNDELLEQQPNRPDRLVFLLRQAGWDLVGGQEGHYSRLRKHGDRRKSSLLVPTNPGTPDYRELMQGAIRQLEMEDGDLWARSIKPRLVSMPSDAIRFRKESAAPSGLIKWDDGQKMIAAARATLVAGAKAHIEPARYFSNRHGQFAARYLESVLMGQTSPGSYIVTAYAPSEVKIALRATDVPTMEYEGIDAARGRAITGTVANALKATSGALDDYRHHGSLEVFDEGVGEGISREMVLAVSGLAEDSGESSISIEWEADVLDLDKTVRRDSFTFTAEDVPVLNAVASRMIEIEPSDNVRIEGRVHLLTRKEAGGPGVVGVDDGSRRYRVRLTSEEAYHSAVMAHNDEKLIEVQGRLEQVGTLSWLYDSTLLRVREPVDNLTGGVPKVHKESRRGELFPVEEPATSADEDSAGR